MGLYGTFKKRRGPEKRRHVVGSYYKDPPNMESRKPVFENSHVCGDYMRDPGGSGAGFSRIYVAIRVLRAMGFKVVEIFRMTVVGFDLYFNLAPL